MPKNDFKILFAGICAFVVAIGTARFAFTTFYCAKFSIYKSYDKPLLSIASFVVFAAILLIGLKFKNNEKILVKV